MGIAVFITQYHIYGLSLNIKNKICRIYLVLEMRNKQFYFLTLFPYPLPLPTTLTPFPYPLPLPPTPFIPPKSSNSQIF